MTKLKLSIIMTIIVVEFINYASAFNPLVPEGMNIMFFFAIILFSCILRIILKKYKIPISHGVFLIVFGWLWGWGAFNDPWILEVSDAMFIPSRELMYVYVPITIFSIAFCMDVSIFLKTLYQILIIGVPVSLITACIFGITISFIIAPQWRISRAIVFGITCAPISTLALTLMRQSIRTKRMAILLEGEVIISLIVGDITYDFVANDTLDYLHEVYHFFCVLVRFFLFGAIFGLLIGFIGRQILRRLHANPETIFIESFAMPFFVYALSRVYVSGNGSFPVFIVGLMMAMERTVLPKKTNVFLTHLWQSIGFIFDTIMTVEVALNAGYRFSELMPFTAYATSLITFITYYTMRLLVFILFLPLTSRLGYGMDLKTLVVCVLGGLKSSFSLAIVWIFEEITIATEAENSKELMETVNIMFFHMTALYFLSLLINDTITPIIINFLGLRKVSIARQMNMNNCLKHIFTKRGRTVAILKMDRFLADTNWPVVMEITNMRHPYQTKKDSKKEEEEEEDEFFVEFRFTYCSDCHRDIPLEASPQELKDMAKEAKMRVLKGKKLCYARQYENGMMSKEGIVFLSQTVELAMDSEEAEIKMDDFEKKFTNESRINRFIRNRVQGLNKNKKSIIKPPRKYVRRICYYICMHKHYERIILILIVIHVLVMIFDILHHFKAYKLPPGVFILIAVLNLILLIIGICEVVMKIMAYSWISIWRHGARTYFKSVWHIIDIVVIILCAIVVIHNMATLTSNHELTDEMGFIVVAIISCVLRLLRVFRICEIFYPKVIRFLDRNADTQLAFSYEIGKSYVIGETEILTMLPYIIDHKEIREQIKSNIEHDRIRITKLLSMVQKEKPWIAITVKTKQSIRTILNSMKDAINQLKSAGWVDAYEQEKIRNAMDELYRKVNSIKTIEPSAPKVIFREVAWMAGDQNIIDFLFSNVIVKKFEPGDVVIGAGNVAEGIYIVVTGLLLLNYSPEQHVIDKLQEYGRLPIADYLTSTQFEEPVVDYIVSGNCVGELSILTERPYDCTITADAHSQVYVLPHNVIKQAIELSPDPVLGLKSRIWKEISVKIAAPLLMTIPAYQTFSQDQIKYALERGFVPDLSSYKIFSVTDMIEDIILIEGIVADFNTREEYVAPCCIPRTVQKLIFPTSSLLNLSTDVETKLLIIPEKDVDEYDVMVLAEQTCELVETGSSSKCLQHAVQQKRKKQRFRMGNIQSGLPTNKRRIAAIASTVASMKEYPGAFSDNASSVLSGSRRDSDPASGFIGQFGFEDEEEEKTFDYYGSKRSDSQ